MCAPKARSESTLVGYQLVQKIKKGVEGEYYLLYLRNVLFVYLVYTLQRHIASNQLQFKQRSLQLSSFYSTKIISSIEFSIQLTKNSFINPSSISALLFFYPTSTRLRILSSVRLLVYKETFTSRKVLRTRSKH